MLTGSPQIRPWRGGPWQSDPMDLIIRFALSIAATEGFSAQKGQFPRLNRFIAAFLGANAHRVLDRQDKHLAIADLAGPRGLDDGLHGLGNQSIG